MRNVSNSSTMAYGQPVENAEVWRSPYQTEGYFGVADYYNLAADKLVLETGVVYFYSGNVKTAWEVSQSIHVDTLEDDQLLYQYAGQIDDMAASSTTSYFTRVVASDDFLAGKYSSRLKRALRHADAYAQLCIADTIYEVKNALNVFEQFPERRDNLDNRIFVPFVCDLVLAGLARVYALRSGRDLTAAAVVLRNEGQINLRYYSAERIFNAGISIMYKILQKEFEGGTRIADLSGVCHPNISTVKDRGITEFKQQFGGKIIEFALMTNA